MQLALDWFLSNTEFDDFDKIFGEISDHSANYSIKAIPLDDQRLKNLRRYSSQLLEVALALMRLRDLFLADLPQMIYSPHYITLR